MRTETDIRCPVLCSKNLTELGKPPKSIRSLLLAEFPYLIHNYLYKDLISTRKLKKSMNSPSETDFI